MNRSAKIFRILSQRIFIFYFIGLLVISFSFDYKDTIDRAKVAALNRLMPDFVEMSKFVQDHNQFDKRNLKDYITCFGQIVEDFSSFAEAWGILGFSYAQLGEMQKAVAAYEKAIVANPNHFWFYHDIAMLYYQMGQSEIAADYFKKALMKNSDATLTFIFSSRVYLPLVKQLEDRNILKANLTKGYQHCYQMLVLLEYRSKKFQEVLRGAQYAIKTNTEPKDFFYYFVGLSAYQLKDYKTAMYSLQESLKLNPKNAETFHYLGLISKDLGKEDMANKFFQEEKLLKNDTPGYENWEASFGPWMM